MVSLDSFAGEKDQASQQKGWIVSLVAHLILVAILFLPMIALQTPPPEEEGVMVSLGMPDEGQGDEPPAQTEEKTESQPEPEPQVTKVTPTQKTAKQVSSKIVTSNEQDEVKVRETEARNKAAAESQRRAAEEAQKQQSYNTAKKSYGDLFDGSGKGNTGKPGSQGDPSGDPNSDALEGISKGSGRVGGGLGGRGLLHEPKISDASQKTGRVVISVCVDKNGKVIRADYTQKGSTTTDSELKDIAKKAALQFKFTPSEIEEQCGTITVDFKIKGQ